MPVWLLIIVIVCSVAFAAMCVKVYCGTAVARWCRRLRHAAPRDARAHNAHSDTGVGLPLAPPPQANAMQTAGREQPHERVHVGDSY